MRKDRKDAPYAGAQDTRLYPSWNGNRSPQDTQVYTGGENGYAPDEYPQNGGAQDGYAPENYAGGYPQDGSAQDGYAPENYAGGYPQDGGAQDGYAPENYAGGYPQDGGAQDGYAPEDYAGGYPQEGGAQDGYAPEDYAGGYPDGYAPEDGGGDGGMPPEDDWDADEPEKPRKRTIFKPRSRHPSFILTVLVNAFRLLVVLILVAGLAGAGTVVGIARAYMDTAPELDLSAIDDQAQTSFIYDADGNLITDYKGTENRVMVSIDTMPEKLRNAFVAVEDARFYTHNGVDVKRIVGSFVANFLTGSQQGGSTITQQLIKNTLLSSEKSYKRKIQEAYLAMQLETRYTKDEILQSYLNTIYLGEDYYGVKTAAYGYFGKDNLNDLTLRECAILAGVCNSPYYYNPRRNFYLRQSDTTDYAKITNDRTDYVLRCMYENQFITREEYEQALDPRTAGVLETSPESNTLYPYPHYVEYAVRDVVQVLLKQEGLENTSANRNKMEQKLRTGGYQVFLALDTSIQQAVEDTLYNWKNYPSLRDPADSVYRARNADGTYDEIAQPQAAAVVMDYRTGEVKAIVGSRTRPTQRKTLNRATDMNMPVGSSIKPIAVYAPAIEMGAGAGTVLYNMPLPISGWTGSDGKDSWPKNYGGSSYRGPETLRRALVRSDNTAAAYALMNYVGVERSADFLLRLGVSEKHINKTPFGLALGSSGITPLEMAVAFSTLANGGVYQTPITFLGIADSSHNMLYDAHQSQERRQVFKPATAYLTVDMMKEVVSSGTGTAARISGQTVAGKTGTNSDQKGVFFAGITGYYTGTVWIGHDNYKALSSKTTGGNSAAKLWQSFMSKIHTGLANRDIMDGSPSDYGLTRVTTCAVSGQLATDACRRDAMNYGTVTDWWPADSAPTSYCQMHVDVTLCASSQLLATDSCPASGRVNQSVVIIPRGHPLYNYIGTSYQGVLTDYLGAFAALRMTGDGTADAALISTMSCTLHQGGASQSGQPNVSQSLLNDAETLLSSARLLMNTVDSGSAAGQNLQSAISYLQSAIQNAQDDATLISAMSTLTQATAGAQ